MDIDKEKERIAEKLINEEDLTEEEIEFMKEQKTVYKFVPYDNYFNAKD